VSAKARKTSGFKCPTCGYLKPPETSVHPRLGSKTACMGCGDHPCSVCDKPLVHPGKAKLVKAKLKEWSAAALIYRRKGDKIVCGECLK
jgi:hypothetical protein